MSKKYALTPLRLAQRDRTRCRIRDAAKMVFHDRHFSQASMEDIANGAGLTRSTLYFHFKDKTEIFKDIVADYLPRAQQMMGQLPGPNPGKKNIKLWIRDVARFTAYEKVSISIIAEVSSQTPGLIDMMAIKRNSCWIRQEYSCIPSRAG